MSENLLSLVIWVPIAAGLLTLATGGEKNAGLARMIALAGSLAGFLLSLPLYFNFQPLHGGMQFVELAPWITSLNINYALGVDGIEVQLRAEHRLLDGGGDRAGHAHRLPDANLGRGGLGHQAQGQDQRPQRDLVEAHVEHPHPEESHRQHQRDHHDACPGQGIGNIEIHWGSRFAYRKAL